MSSNSPAAGAWFEDPTGAQIISTDVQRIEEEAQKMGVEVHYLYAVQQPEGVKLTLGPGGAIMMSLALRDGTPYEVELPEGHAEVILRNALEAQRARPESGIGTRAGATIFDMKVVLEALGKSVSITRVPGGKKQLSLSTNKSLEDLGL